MLLIDRALDADERRRTSQGCAMAICKIGKKSDAPIIFASKQSIDADIEQVEPGTSKQVGVL
ncbi:hypothetical protein AAFG07_31890 [Bradyrhizobium sp. B097]|uniref:hypothetical protein n=1 Tax=Bradyrhizobium sp. B097 TaxID=3140244 RepID=UPI0031832F39